MLLNDIGKLSDAAFRKINQHLETNYGFKISEDISDKDLVSIMEQIEEEITDLKIKGDDTRTSPEISKRLLILEGIQNLREFAMMQFQSPDLTHVINTLSDFVCDCFRISGTCDADYEDAIRDCMKSYRSSRYRFPDSMVEQQVRQMALRKIQGQSTSNEPGINIDAPVLESDKDNNMKKREVDEAGGSRHDDIAWAAQDKHHRSSSAAANPQLSTKGASRAAGGDFDYEMQHEPEMATDGKPIPMMRNKDGRMVPDPFAAQAAARRKGIVMKEKANLVKNLRRLLETEVSQAEVMMAAKGFAQELQEMIEKIGRLQNEDLPPVTDQMRETYGMESASAFQTQIYGALQNVMDSLYTAKGQVDDAVSNMADTGQITATVDMEKDPAMGDMGDMEDPAMAMDADLDNIGDELDGEMDDFGGAEEEEPLGRSMKAESVKSLNRKVMEMKKLVDKARKLREARG